MADQIHQFYCTHCTYGTSALHRRADGAMKDQAFEYSTRASSVGQEKCHDYFRKLEPYLYLHLPGDAPPTDLTRYTGEDCPWRRLVFLPAVGGLDILAHVCYRQTDTRGRPGSYFAHALMRESAPGVRRWSAEDCLKLWGRPEWVIADSSEFEFDLAPVDSLTDFCSSETPFAIDDAVLHSFLTAEPTDEFVDPGDVVPERWRSKSQAERRQLLVDVLQSVLDLSLDPPRRDSVIVAIEPSLAALIFYGVARLLPRKGIGERLSFSTFESHHDLPRTFLAAVTFNDPDKADLPAEMYRSGNFVLNSYSGNRSTNRKSTCQPIYASAIVDRFVSPDDGIEWIEEFRSRCDYHQLTTGTELNECIAAQEVATSLLAPQRKPASAPTVLPKSKKHRAFLRELVAVRLNELGCDSSQFQELAAETERSLDLIRVLSGDRSALAARDEFDVLLNSLPDSALSKFLTLSEVDPSDRLAVLARSIEQKQQLPPGCEWLWTGRPSASVPSDAPSLEDLFCELKPETLDHLLDGLFEGDTSDESLKVAARSLVKAVVKDRQKQAQAAHFFKRVSLATLRDCLFDPQLREYLLTEEVANQRVHKVLSSLLAQVHQGGPRFQERIDVLSADRGLLTPKARERVRAWQGFCKQIETIRGLQADEPGRLARIISHRHQHDLEDACERLRNFAETAFPDELTGVQRQKQYRNLIGTLLPGGGLLAPLTRFNGTPARKGPAISAITDETDDEELEPIPFLKITLIASTVCVLAFVIYLICRVLGGAPAQKAKDATTLQLRPRHSVIDRNEAKS